MPFPCPFLLIRPHIHFMSSDFSSFFLSVPLSHPFLLISSHLQSVFPFLLPFPFNACPPPFSFHFPRPSPLSFRFPLNYLPRALCSSIVLSNVSSELLHIISYRIVSYHVSYIIYHIISYIISYHIISYHVISYHIISYHIMSCHIISYHIMSCHVISYHVSYHIISYHINLVGNSRSSPHCRLFFCQQDELSVTPSILGRISSYYYLSHLTLRMFSERLHADCSLPDLLEIMTVSHK